MADSKISFSFGNLTFSGEGEEKWLGAQLEKIISAAKDFGITNATKTPTDKFLDADESWEAGDFKETLAAYLRDKKAENNQNRRFLVTADWLRRKGKTPLTASAVSKALKDNQQKRLGNPADCLNKNVGKGFCEKTGNGFFITPDGLQSIG
jgi:hypothetical protein